ncbi:MAG: NADH-quinone oxidoreductase subunit C [Candidatus Zixiibacteriota bacterium]|nr:MAG: NADH-quinone oxidoreductase subunit C [candidate division Zixibacteria bacterium]
MTTEQLKDYIASRFPVMMTLLETGRREPMYEVKAGQLLEVCRALRDDETLKFNYLCNIGAVDTQERLEIVYSIASVPNRLRLDFKVVLPREGASIESVQEIWPAANWYEREMWELYGVDVKAHDNLKRFLLPDDWDKGHPMRKDWDDPDFVRFPEIE